ncbi:Electron transport complex protein RnfG [Methanosarcina siciliae C2J]|uniref:Ion-translocating oxidoreductase complex subunit G n=1 Tax=Methanosarcina siciliae C2J TaxID=1434118 RepID=A0A0E3PJM8_9EURY|nr:Rnf electron transport complex subunit RnfG [Methanosarcina siciliae]AKB35187.1 Electron transport complex protein RnfG [Methanosarcina siciliae C2J]
MSDGKEVMKVIVTIVVISAVAAALLALTYTPTQEQLKLLHAEQQKEAMKEILPQASDFEEVAGSEVDDDGNPVVLYYRGVDSSGNVVGYVVERNQVGAQGMIQLLAGISSDFSTITGFQVMKHSETPGLGALITTPEFQGQFVDLPVADTSLTKNGGQVDAISGATISSQAVVDALHSAVDYVSAQEG